MDYRNEELRPDMVAFQNDSENTDSIKQLIEKALLEECATDQQIQALRERIDFLHDTLKVAEKTEDNRDTILQIKKDLANDEDELAKGMKKKADLSRKIKAFQERSFKNFDKFKLFKNIRELAGKKNVRLGQIERDAGCQPGYMSRLEKPDNTTDPTVEFIVTAAEALEVSIDLLIYSDFSDMSPTEIYVAKFIEQLIKDTREDKITWKTQADSSDLFASFYETSNDPGIGNGVLEYKSSFFPDKNIECSYKSYCVQLGTSGAFVYLMRCLDSEKKPYGSGEYFEVYITDIGGTVNPVFCTVQAGDVMNSLVDRLYEQVEISVTHIHVNDDVRELIDSYMKSAFGRKP